MSETVARGILERYAQSNEELEALTPQRRRDLDAEFMELQESYQDRILPLLSDDQKTSLWTTQPHVLRFNYGRNSHTTGYGQGIF